MPRLYFGRNLESEPRDALTESHHSLDVKTANVTIRQRTSNIDLELSSNETVKSVFSHDEAALKERVRPSVCHALVALLLFGLLGATYAVYSALFSSFFELQFCISVMFLGLPDDTHEEKSSFLQFRTCYRRTDQPTDGRTYPLKRWEDASKKEILKLEDSAICLVPLDP